MKQLHMAWRDGVAFLLGAALIAGILLLRRLGI